MMTPPDARTVARLPPELLLAIFAYIGPNDLPAVASVCRHWAAVLLATSPLTLNLAGQRAVDDAYIHFVATKLSVRSLDLSSCRYVSESSIRRLLSRAWGLRHLRIASTVIGAFTAHHLRTLDYNLESLDLTGSEMPYRMDNWVSAHRLKKLCLTKATLTLHIENAWNWRQFQALEHLELSHISSHILIELAYLPRLRVLKLAFGDIRVTDDTLRAFARIEVLELHSVCVSSNYPIRPTWAALADVLEAAPHLRELKLDDIRPLLNDISVSKWLEHCRSLERIDLCCADMGGAINVGPLTLAALGEHVGPSLRHVNLFQCNASDQSVLHLLERAPNLESIALPYCLLLTDAAAVPMTTLCPKLKSVDVSGCANVTSLFFEALLKNCRNLQTVRAYGLHETLQAQEGAHETVLPAIKLTTHTPRRDPEGLFFGQNNTHPHPMVNETNPLWSHISPIAQSLVSAGIELIYQPRASMSVLPRAQHPPGIREDAQESYFQPQEGECTSCSVLRCAAPDCEIRLPSCHMESHREICIHALVPCVNRAVGCPAQVERHQLASHMFQCPFYKVHCSLCHQTLERNQYERHMDEHNTRDWALPKVPRCPLRNEGCLHSSGDINKHLNTDCDRYIMLCNHCTDRVPRSSLFVFNSAVERPKNDPSQGEHYDCEHTKSA